MAMAKVGLLGPSEIRPGEGVPIYLGLHLPYRQHHFPEEEEAWRAPLPSNPAFFSQGS